MNYNQFKAHQWLSRMDNCQGELKMLYNRRDEIVNSMSGVSKYDDKAIKGGSDPNPTEAKLIEYSTICARIEKLEGDLSTENTRTLNIIDQVKDSKLRGMLIGRYINHLSWSKVGKIFYYAKSTSYIYQFKCLDAAFPFIPKDEIIPDDNKYQSLNVWNNLD